MPATASGPAPALLLALALAAPVGCLAQARPGQEPASPAPPAAASRAAPPAAPAPPNPAPGPASTPARDGSANEPAAAWLVAEDEHVRVEELRVRGESRHIVVQPKLPGARPYEIVPSSGALDPSQRGRRAPGTSLWRVLSF